MRLAPNFFALCLLLFRLCNGAPPKEVGSSSSSRSYTKFTDAEDQFIIDELLSFPLNNSPEVLGKMLWGHISEKHRKMWEQNTPGFPCERTCFALRRRLTNTLIRNYPYVKVKVPESLLQKFPRLHQIQFGADIRAAYTPEEERFISKELLKPAHTSPYAKSTWEAIRAEHEEKRKREERGFEIGRTAGGLRKHMTVMKQQGLLPNEVLSKLRIYKTGSRSSESTPRNANTEIQERNESQDDDEWADSLIQDPLDDDLPDLS